MLEAYEESSKMAAAEVAVTLKPSDSVQAFEHTGMRITFKVRRSRSSHAQHKRHSGWLLEPVRPRIASRSGRGGVSAAPRGSAAPELHGPAV